VIVTFLSGQLVEDVLFPDVAHAEDDQQNENNLDLKERLKKVGK
jgi:hypothetical protein